MKAAAVFRGMLASGSAWTEAVSAAAGLAEESPPAVSVSNEVTAAMMSPRLAARSRAVEAASAIAWLACTTLHFAVADADLALVDEAGSEVIVAGEYQLVFSDGTTELVSKLTLPASAARTISTLPPGAPGPAPASGQ